MWKIKTFKTEQAMNKFIYTHRIAYRKIEVSYAPFAIEYIPLKDL